MTIEEMIGLLLAELKDDVVGTIKHEGNMIVIAFTNGIERTITVA